MVVSAVTQGFRAKVTDRAPWTVMGAGVGATWLATMVVGILAPVWVTGTDPTKIPIWAGISAIAGLILTWILCRSVATVWFHPAPSQVEPATISPTTDVAPDERVTVMLHRLAQLHDAGVISDAEFQAKKDELLTRI
jgi:hypothetical protein